MRPLAADVITEVELGARGILGEYDGDAAQMAMISRSLVDERWMKEWMKEQIVRKIFHVSPRLPLHRRG